MHNLWKGFFAAVTGTLYVRLVGSMGLVALFSTNFQVGIIAIYCSFVSFGLFQSKELPYDPYELIAFGLIGRQQPSSFLFF